METPLPKRWEEVDLMFRVQRAKHGAIQAALSREGLQDVGQPKILFYLGEAEADGELPAQQELARRLGVSPATVAASLKSLERMGYISRETDTADARKKRISITDKGRKARERCIAVFEQVDQQMFIGFSPQELTLLRRSYERMLDNLAVIGGRDDRWAVPPLSPNCNRKEETDR